MKEALMSVPVLAMYDVRGIQDYVFRSNAAKEIIGASILIDNIVKNGLKTYIERLGKDVQSLYMTDWEADEPDAFLENPSILMQVMFVGGGNAYVLFRRGEDCQKVNRFLARYLLEKTYSLNLAVAVVEKTESYADDYAAINEEMRRIKAYMPSAQPVGALPFMKADPNTGYPLTCREKPLHGGQNADRKTAGKNASSGEAAAGVLPEEYICTEARLKRDSFVGEEEKVFDNMVTEKGDNSTLAVCHIDGNSMGSRIKETMQKEENRAYGTAIRTMRGISKEIGAIFGNTFSAMTQYMEKLSPEVKKFRNGKTSRLYRKIIVAGDDITFVCNAKLAIPAVKFFLRSVGKTEGGAASYSACGGIAFFNSHFPFSDAYQVAEACCESAKERAKAKENRRKDGSVGNFFDFQICTNIRAAQLDDYRSRHYFSGNDLFIARPYFVPGAADDEEFKDKNKKYDVAELDYWCSYFNGSKEESREKTDAGETLPRSKAKALRNVIPSGKDAIEKQLNFLESRGFTRLSNAAGKCDPAARKALYAVWYDALEIMDLTIGEANEADN